MVEKSNSAEQFRLYTIHSQKGGVGKTALAIAIAGLESSIRKSKTLLIDTDITGTCIVDSIGSKPTDFAEKSYFGDLLLANPDEFLRLITLPRGRPKKGNRWRKSWNKYLCPLPFRDKNKPGFDILQSICTLSQLRDIIPSLAQEHYLHFYAERLHDILLAVAGLDYRTVILDLPSGLFGFSESAFNLAYDTYIGEDMQQVGVEKFKSRAIVVTTTGKAACRATFPLVRQLEKEFKWNSSNNEKNSSGIEIWFNRIPYLSNQESICRKEILKDSFKDLQDLLAVPRRFGIRSKDVQEWSKAFHQKEQSIIESDGAVLPFISSFSTDKILHRLVELINGSHTGQPDEQEHTMDIWLRGVAKAIGLKLD